MKNLLKPNESALVVNINTGEVKIGISKIAPENGKVTTSELMLLIIYDLLKNTDREFMDIIEKYAPEYIEKIIDLRIK